MSRFRLFVFFTALLSLLTCVNAQADDTTQVIITPVPAPKEVVVAPQGYESCFTVQAGWFKDVWVPQHRVCQYSTTPAPGTTVEGVAWVEGYWACTKAEAQGVCTNWDWKPGRWVKTFQVY